MSKLSAGGNEFFEVVKDDYEEFMTTPETQKAIEEMKARGLSSEEIAWNLSRSFTADYIRSLLNVP